MIFVLVFLSYFTDNLEGWDGVGGMFKREETYLRLIHIDMWQKPTQYCKTSISSVQFSHSVVSNSLLLHESQHARPPCPSSTPGVHSDSCPSSQ